MGVGNLQIGIGQGGAQEFGHNPAVQQFGEMLAEKKAKHEQEVKMLGDELAKGYDPSGLRNDADKSKYLKTYGDIKQSAIDAENEKDPTKRAFKLSEVRQQLTNLGAYAEGSKKQGEFERNMALAHLKNRYLLDNDSADKLKNQMSKTWDDPDVIHDASGFARGVNPDELTKKYDKLKKDAIEPTQWSNPVKTSTLDFDGNKKAIFQQNRGVPIDGDNGAYHRFLNTVSLDDDWQKGLHDMYPDVNTGDSKMDLALRARKYMHDNGDVHGWIDKPKEIPMEGQPTQRYTKLQQYNIDHYGTPNSPTTATSMEASPIVQKYIAPMVNGGQAELQKFADLVPKGQFRKGEAVKPEVVNGYHVLHIPDQVEIDQKIAKANENAKQKYEANPDKEKGFGPIQWGKVIPWEQSDAYKQTHKDPYKVKTPGADVTLDPNDKADYAAKAVAIAKQLKVPMTEINTELGKKGGKGLRPEFQGQQNKQHDTPTIKSNEEYTKLPKGTHFIWSDGQEYIKQ